MKKLISAVREMRDIKGMSFIEASALAYDTAKAAGVVRSYEDVGRRLNIGTETVHRYFTDPDYNCPAKRIPEMCRVLGNTIMIEWQLAQINGHMYVVEPDARPGTLIDLMVSLRKELGDVLVCDSAALLDGAYKGMEIHLLAKELRELLRAVESAIRMVEAETKGQA